MNYLMAKAKGRRGNYFIVMTKEEDIYPIPDFAHNRAYIDDIKLEDDEWFAVENFSDQSYSGKFIKDNFDATAYSNLPRDKYPELAFIVSVQGNYYCFQKIVESIVLHKQLIDFKLDQEPVLLNCKHSIVLSNRADAYYDKDEDIMYFKKLSDITTLFDGISILYNEATDSETDSFLKLDILSVEEGYGKSDVKTANRRRIKAAMDKYNSFDEGQKERIPTYLRRYVDDVPFEDGKFKIKGEEDLSKILNCLNQRYYTTEIDDEKRLANSVTKL